MSFDPDDYDQLDRDDVIRLMDEIRDDSQTSYVVVRDRDDEEVEAFDSEEKAANYIDEEDLNPARFTVREDEDEEATGDLDALESFDDECRRDVQGWGSGTVVYRRDFIDGEFAQERYASSAPAGVDFDESPYRFIDWDDVANELISDSQANSSYATVKGTRFYYLPF